MLIGRNVGVVPEHAHYAIQVTLGSEPGVRFQSAPDESWVAYDCALIPSRQPHSMDARNVRANAVILVERETVQGRALTELYLNDGIAALSSPAVSAARAALFDAWDRRSANDLKQAVRSTVETLAGGVRPSTVSDDRILRAIAYINSHLDKPLTLEEVASEAFLSPSRFRHLFVEETGTALRPYILWRRFVLVWELLMEGVTLSAAAHRAGFADSAHLTRTSRTMFGFPPSALVMEGPLLEQQPAATAAAGKG